MEQLEITWRRVLSVWWLIFWRGFVGATLLGIMVGFVAGVVVGSVLALSGDSYDGAAFEVWSGNAGRIAGGVAGIVWGIYVVQMALRKKYKEFRLVLISEPQR